MNDELDQKGPHIYYPLNWTHALLLTFFCEPCSLQYFDSVATLAAEVHNPAKTFPKAMRIVTPLVVFMYLSAVMLGVGVSPEGSVWHSSYFADVSQIVSPCTLVGDLFGKGRYADICGVAASPLIQVAYMIGGWWLQYLVIVGTLASCVGQFEAETSENAFALLGMSERRMLPKVFSTRSRFGTPSVGIWGGMVVTIMCVQMENLSDIVELLNVVVSIHMPLFELFRDLACLFAVFRQSNCVADTPLALASTCMLHCSNFRPFCTYDSSTLSYLGRFVRR